MKKLVIGVLAVIVVGLLGLFIWVRAVLSSDAVRTTLASTLSEKLGQPVAIGGIGASILPRISVNLDSVAIGKPGQLSVGQFAIGTNLTALLSRRIEHATVRLNGAHVTLPLVALPANAGPPSAAPSPAAASTSPAVQLVSVDEIELNDVEITSGGRTVRADIDLAIDGQAATVKKIALRANDTIVDITGSLTDYMAPAGTLSVQAGKLNVTDLIALITDFAKGAGLSASTASATPAAAPATSGKMNLTLTLGADRATIGNLILDHLSGQARITDTAITIDPARFDVFGGKYSGSVALTLGDTPEFRVNANLTGIDMAQVMTFAGQAGLLTGHMAGTLSLTGRGLSAADVIASARGTVHAAITNGTVKGLGLVNGVVEATSMRGGSLDQAKSASGTESFSSLDGTFTIANGAATTSDLTFTSTDLLLSATGNVRLDGSAINLSGPLQLSDALSKQAGRDLVKYTQQNGRVTVPAEVSGSADNLHVGINTSDLAKRAVTNAAGDQAKKLLGRIGRKGGGG